MAAVRGLVAAHFDLDGDGRLALLADGDLLVVALDGGTVCFALVSIFEKSNGRGCGRKGGETYTLPRSMISLAPVTAFCLTAEMGVLILSEPSTTSTPMTIGPDLLKTATGESTQGKTASSLDSSFFFSSSSSICLVNESKRW